MENRTSNPQFWDNLYQTHDTGWDIGYPSTPLKEYIDQLQDKQQAILIPGCGNSYEAEYMLEKGFTNITLVDISPTLTAALKTRLNRFLGKQLEIITSDFFNITGQYDLILEQTFLCALDPSLRKRYVEKMHGLLKPGGTLAGALFNRDFESCPPFGGSKEEYDNLFGEKFDIRVMEPCYNSIAPRMGSELFVILER